MSAVDLASRDVLGPQPAGRRRWTRYITSTARGPAGGTRGSGPSPEVHGRPGSSTHDAQRREALLGLDGCPRPPWAWSRCRARHFQGCPIGAGSATPKARCGPVSALGFVVLGTGRVARTEAPWWTRPPQRTDQILVAKGRAADAASGPLPRPDETVERRIRRARRRTRPARGRPLSRDHARPRPRRRAPRPAAAVHAGPDALDIVGGRILGNLDGDDAEDGPFKRTTLYDRTYAPFFGEIPRTPSRWRAPIRCPRPSSTGSFKLELELLPRLRDPRHDDGRNRRTPTARPRRALELQALGGHGAVRRHRARRPAGPRHPSRQRTALTAVRDAPRLEHLGGQVILLASKGASRGATNVSMEDVESARPRAPPPTVPSFEGAAGFDADAVARAVLEATV